MFFLRKEFLSLLLKGLQGQSILLVAIFLFIELCLKFRYFTIKIMKNLPNYGSNKVPPSPKSQNSN